jgi:hypothetical protein
VGSRRPAKMLVVSRYSFLGDFYVVTGRPAGTIVGECVLVVVIEDAAAEIEAVVPFILGMEEVAAVSGGSGADRGLDAFVPMV